MIGSSGRGPSWPADSNAGKLPADQWDWHEVVPNGHLSPAHSHATRSGWTWGRTWTAIRLSVLPLLVTALALTTALLTLVGLVARPLPWSPAPVFGGSSNRQAAPAPTSRPALARAVPAPARPVPSSTASTPRDTTGATGAAASATPLVPSTPGSVRPARAGASISTSSNAPVLKVPLPSLPVSVSVSISGPLPLPPLIISLP
jgi:hypothetical protein